MVDFGGMNVAELTENTKDALLDPNGFRTLATAQNPLASISDRIAGNLLINGGFQFAQRQTPDTYKLFSGISAIQYYAPDRWALLGQNNSMSYKRVDAITPETGLQARYYGKFQKNTNPGKFAIVQPLEATMIANHRGKTLRLQAKMKFSVAASMKVRLGLLYLTSAGTTDSITNGAGTFITAWGAIGTDPTWCANVVALAPTLPSGGSVNGLGLDCNLTNAWVNYSAVFSIPADCKNLYAVIWSDGQLAANDEFNISEAGLYPGAGLQGWFPIPEADEIRLVRRYYYKTFSIDAEPLQNAGFAGALQFLAVTAGATDGTVQIRFPVMMRARTPGAPVPVDFATLNPAASNSQVRDVTAGADGSTTGPSAQGPDNVQITFKGNGATVAGNLLSVHLWADAEMY